MTAPLRIGVWNLNHARGAAARTKRMALIEGLAADLWILTETNDHHAPDGFVGVHSEPRADSPAGGRWASIWSRHRVVRQLDVEDPNRTCAALIETPQGALVVFGTVIPWEHDRGEPPRDPTPRNWREQYRVIPLQGAEWASLRAAHPSAKLCIAGDLNISLGGGRYYGTKVGRDLLAQAMAKAGLACLTRYESLPPGALAYPMIDHVLIDTGCAGRSRVAAAWEGRTADGAKLSDHSGALVEVHLGQPTP